MNKPAKQARQSGGKKGWIIALALVAIVVLGVCSYGFVLKNQDAIYPNVYVAGVNVGGLKRTLPYRQSPRRSRRSMKATP